MRTVVRGYVKFFSDSGIWKSKLPLFFLCLQAFPHANLHLQLCRQIYFGAVTLFVYPIGLRGRHGDPTTSSISGIMARRAPKASRNDVNGLRTLAVGGFYTLCGRSRK